MQHLGVVLLIVFWCGAMLGLFVGALLAASQESDARKTD